MPSIISTKTSGGGGIAVTGDTSGVLQLQSANGTTAVTIDASQNVGIGTASPSAPLHIFNSSSPYTLYKNSTTTNGSSIGVNAGSSDMFLYNADAGAVVVSTNATERMRITAAGLLQFNSGYGSVATAYGCRAWVNFNGTGTVAIRASGNVTSITDNGTGDYTVNFTTAMPDANYNVVGASQIDTNAAYITSFGSDGLLSIKRGVASPLTTGSARIGTGSTNNSLVDNTINCISIFR